MITQLYTFFTALIFLNLLLGCTTKGQPITPPTNETTTLPSRNVLAQSFFGVEKPPVLLVYASGDAASIDKYRRIADSIQQQSQSYLTLTIKSDVEVQPADWADRALVVLGTPKSNKIIANLLEELPFKIQASNLQFNELDFQDASTVMLLPFYPNPLNPQFPLAVFSGLTDQAICDFMWQKIEKKQGLFGWGSFGYEIYQHQKRILLGYFDEESWEVNHQVHFSFNTAPEKVLETEHYEFFSHFPLTISQLREFAKHAETAATRILAFTQKEKPTAKIAHFLYPSTEKKGLMLQNTEQAQVDFRQSEVHTVLNDTYHDNFIGKENELFLRQLLGKPTTIALERGLAIYFTSKWQRKGYAYWAAKLAKSNNWIPLSEVFNEQIQNHGSRLLTGCLAASFVEFAIAEFGAEDFLKKYLTWLPTENEIEHLEKQWRAYLLKQVSNVQFTQQNVEIPYLKGFNFAHEGYRIYNGYGSAKATESLEKLATMGVNAVAIVPYGYMREPQKPAFISITNQAGSENDESVIHAAAMAKNMGMTVVLKPQIWIHWNSWPGDVAMTSETDWEQFFHYYHHWIAHYAMLAEIHEMELFCLGVEFAKATLARTNDWQTLIQKIRKLYTGKLTYAANWGDEFEKITFWNEVDYIGLNCYYPLGQSEEMSKRELVNAFEKVMDKIERVQKQYDKPLIFTEIGFRSITAPWKEPHAGNRSDPYNGEHQKRCYETVLECLKNEAWCQGILWWKFPSYLEHRGNENGGFTPNNKLAEEVVRKWFGN